MPFPDPPLRPCTAALLTIALAGCLHVAPAPAPPTHTTEIFIPLDDTHDPVPSEPAHTSPTWVDEHVAALAPDGNIDAEAATAATVHPVPADPQGTPPPRPTKAEPTAPPALPSPGTDERATDPAPPPPPTSELNLELPEPAGALGGTPPTVTSDTPAPDTPPAIASSTAPSDQTPHSPPAAPEPDVAVTQCPGTEASATAQCLLDTVRMRTARAGETLIDTINRWATVDGWDLVVETQYDWPLRTSHTTATGLDTAIRQITEAFSRTQPAPTATAYRCNCVLVVRDNAHRPG